MKLAVVFVLLLGTMLSAQKGDPLADPAPYPCSKGGPCEGEPPPPEPPPTCSKGCDPEPPPSVPPPSGSSVVIDTQHVLRTMAGGIGASWHAIRLAGDFRGSAWGGNPPLGDEFAWAEIEKHATWLGLDFLRVELDQRMYEPARGLFDWHNDEMQTLYRILDWTERNHADVFLSQMWQHVDWNIIPGLVTKTPGSEIVASAPHSLPDFANGMATMVDHLQRTKGYTLGWLNIVNEPGNWWWLGNGPVLDGLKAVKIAFDARGITLPLSGPGTTAISEKDAGLRAFTGTENDEFATFGGAYDMHSYDSSDGIGGPLLKWAQFAHSRGKPFFVTELGDMTLPWGGSSAGPKSWDAVLSNTAKILQGLAVGVDGFSRWSFLNRGDLDGQWQLVRTWDRSTRAYLQTPVPEPVPYFGFAMLTRFTAKHSDILAMTGTACGPMSALRSPSGHLTVILLNPSAAACDTTVRLAGLQTAVTLDRYALTEPVVALVLGVPVIFTVVLPEAVLTLPARSVTTLTSYQLQSHEPGVIAD